MVTCTAVRGYRLRLTWRCAVESNSFVLDTNFLQKSDSLLLVIDQGNNLNHYRVQHMDVLKSVRTETRPLIILPHLDYKVQLH